MLVYSVKNVVPLLWMMPHSKGRNVKKNLLGPLHTDTCSRPAVCKPRTNLILDLQSQRGTVGLVYWLLSKSAKWWETPSGSVRTKTRTWLAQCMLHHRDLASMTSWPVTERERALTCHSLELNRKRKQANSRRNLHSIIHLAVKECYSCNVMCKSWDAFTAIIRCSIKATWLQLKWLKITTCLCSNHNNNVHNASCSFLTETQQLGINRHVCYGH